MDINGRALLEALEKADLDSGIDMWDGNLVEREHFIPVAFYIFKDGGVAVVRVDDIEDFEFCFSNARRIA